MHQVRKLHRQCSYHSFSCFRSDITVYGLRKIIVDSVVGGQEGYWKCKVKVRMLVLDVA